MKSIKLFSTILLILAVSLTSCKKDDDNNIAKPVITLEEFGAGNSGVGYPGTEFHLEAEIVAEGKIKLIEVHIHPEDAPGSDWEEEIEFTDDADKKNTTFHKHIEIPTTAKVGTYHFHLKVVDQEGQESEVEKDLEIKELSDDVMPEIKITNPENTEARTFKSGDEITISGLVTDNIGIAGLYVGLVKVSDNLADREVNHENTITLLHTHHFEEADEVPFDAKLKVGAEKDNDITPKTIKWEAGEYYLIVKAPNLGGNGASISEHYPVTIEL